MQWDPGVRGPRPSGVGYVHVSEGDYDYYIEKRNARLAKAEAESAVLKKPQSDLTLPESNKPPKKLKWKEARELETIEKDILSAESEVKRIEAIFSSPDFYTKFGEQTVQSYK
jgi:hypothetical protein